MGLKNWGRGLANGLRRIAGHHVRKYVVPILPHIATPVALGAAISTGALVFFFHIADDVRQADGVWHFDHDGLQLGLSLRTPRRTALMQFVSALARPDVMIYIGLASIVVAWRRPKYRSKGVLLAVALAGGGSIIGIIKRVYARQRPDMTGALAHEATFSFPSGHSFAALCFYGILANWWIRTRPNWFSRIMVTGASTGMIALIGASRVYLGVHYPSDVLAGYAAAVPWLTACLAAYDRYERKVASLPPGPQNLPNVSQNIEEDQSC